MTGWANVRLLGRGKRFRDAPDVVRALVRRHRSSRKPDGLVFSGDATGMGFASEVLVAAKALGVGEGELPAVAVPGNHDYYTRRAVRAGYFEQAFGPWLHGLRVDAETYPFARQVGHVWLVCVNSSRYTCCRRTPAARSARPSSTGCIGCARSCRPGARILVTHYPLRTADGRVEPKVHRLAGPCRGAGRGEGTCGVGLWLHGHIHRRFVLSNPRPTSRSPWCVPAARPRTTAGAYAEYEIEGRAVRGTVAALQPRCRRIC